MTTRLHADLDRRASVHAAAMPWVPSPIEGVHRRMLHRVGDEVAQATTIVRYAPGSRFAAHAHPAGEEFVVLDGVFQDEHGDHPAGSYVRNPPGTRHTPGAADGCTIFVKLRQFDAADRHAVRLDTRGLAPSADARRAGVGVVALHRDAREDVRIEHWAPGARIELELPGGGEFLVLEGGFDDAGEAFSTHSWLRLPSGARLDVRAGARGATVWAKLGHLPFLRSLQPPASASTSTSTPSAAPSVPSVP